MGALRDLLCNCKAFHLGNRYLILSFQSWTKCESSDGREKMVTTMERRETRRTRSRTEMTRTRRMSRWSPQTTTSTTILFLFTSLAVTQAHVALTFPPARWRTFTFFASYFFFFWVPLFLTLYFLGSKIWASSPSPTPTLILAYRGSDLHSWPKSRPNRPFSFRNANLDFNFLHFLPNAQIGEHKYPFWRIYPKFIALVTKIQKQQLYSYNT